MTRTHRSRAAATEDGHATKTAQASSYKPTGLPERTITEAKVMEFGPVTFPAYEDATAASGASLTGTSRLRERGNRNQ